MTDKELLDTAVEKIGEYDLDAAVDGLERLIVLIAEQIGTSREPGDLLSFLDSHVLFLKALKIVKMKRFKNE